MQRQLAANLVHIERLARLVRVLCVLGGIAVLLLPLALWSQPACVAEMVKKEWGGMAVQLGWAARLGGLAATALPTGVGAWSLWEIWRLFGCYARGDLLSLRPARHLRRLGVALVSLAVALPLSQTLIVLALTLGNPSGQRTLWLGVSSAHYLSLLFGLVLLAVSTVLAEAARVADENAEFV